MHKIVRTVANQAEYPSLNIRPSRGAADSDNSLEWNLVPEVLKLILFAAGSGRIPNRIIATLLRPMLQQQLHSAVTRSLTTKSSHRRVRPTHRNAHAARTFASGMMEAMMPFSLSSYLLGVGTVVGALAFGFGGGVLLTKTAMKDSSPAESRVERVARAEPASPPPQAVEAKSAPTPPAEPRPPATSLPEDLADQLVTDAPGVWMVGEQSEVLAGDLALCHPPLGDDVCFSVLMLDTASMCSASAEMR